MFESRSAFGFFVQTPCGPRKSGMPDSVEMPAPVSATTRADASSHSHTLAIESALCKPLIVRRWPVNRRNRLVVEPQIHGQLPPMMSEMVQRVAEHDMARRFHHLFSVGQQPPARRLEEIVVRLRQRLASFH